MSFWKSLVGACSGSDSSLAIMLAAMAAEIHWD